MLDDEKFKGKIVRFHAGSTNPENLRQIFQVKLLLEAKDKWSDDYEIPSNVLEAAEKVLPSYLYRLAKYPVTTPTLSTLRTCSM